MKRTDAASEEDKQDTFAEERARRKSHLETMRLFATVMEDGTFFAGRTALYAYGAPIDPGELLQIGCFAPRRAPKRRGIEGRQIAAHLAGVRTFKGMPLASPASAWAMLASTLEVRELIIIGDALVQIPRDERGRQQPERVLATIAQLRAAADAGPRPGRPKLLAALEHIRVGSSSPLETEYRIDAASAGLPDAHLDVQINDERGRRIGISEFVYPDHRVIVEVEGDHHRTSRAQWRRDIAKYEAYKAAGWDVVRVTSSHIRGSYEAVLIVGAALRRHGWEGQVRFT